MVDLYELGECEVVLRRGDEVKHLIVSPSSRAGHMLKYDDSQKGKAVLVGLHEVAEKAGWVMALVVPTAKSRK